MRIGVDARPLESDKPTGIGIYLINVLSYIANNDKENEYVLYVIRKPKVDYPFIKDNFSLRIIDGKIGTLWARYTLPKYIKKEHIDVFWGTQHILPRKVKGIRTVLTVHDLALLINPKWGSRKNAIMQNIFAKKSIKCADKIIAISESTKKDIINLLKVDAKKIVKVYNGVNTLDDAYDDSISELPQVKKYFLFIGTIEPRKNLFNIIKSFSIFANNNKDVDLIIAGGLGWRYEPIMEEYNNSPNKDRIHMIGYINKAQKSFLLKNCLGFVFPTNYEGFGIPPLEAMQFGKPAILSNVSSLPEIGKDVAIYVAPNDIDGMVEAYNKLVNLSQKEIDEIDEKSKEIFNSFSWEKCASQTLAALLGK